MNIKKHQSAVDFYQVLLDKIYRLKYKFTHPTTHT